MLRWGCLTLGVAAIALGIVGFLMHPPMPVEPSSLTVEEAVVALQRHDRLFVTVSAPADPSRRVYSTVCERPVFGSRPPGKVYELGDLAQLSQGELASYLGVVVQVGAPLAPETLRVRVIRKKRSGEEYLSGERLLAPLAGMPGLWVVSPLYSESDTGDRMAFLSRTEHIGALSSLADIDANIGSYRLAMDAEEIAATAKQRFGLTLDETTLVLLTDLDEPSPGHFRVPIISSGDILFVGPFPADEELPGWVTAGPIRGLMWAWESNDTAGVELATVLGHELPPRYGVINHNETASDHNRKTTFGLKLFTGLGSAFLVISGLAFAIRRWRN